MNTLHESRVQHVKHRVYHTLFRNRSARNPKANISCFGANEIRCAAVSFVQKKTHIDPFQRPSSTLFLWHKQTQPIYSNWSKNSLVFRVGFFSEIFPCWQHQRKILSKLIVIAIFVLWHSLMNTLSMSEWLEKLVNALYKESILFQSINSFMTFEQKFHSNHDFWFNNDIRFKFKSVYDFLIE